MPNGFTIPIPFLNISFKIYFYGIIIMMGVLAATTLTYYEAKRRGLNTESIWDMLIWVMIGGILGARLWHIFTPPPSMVLRGITTQYYLTHPLAMIDIRNGGLGIPGAVLGGGLALWIYTRAKKMSLVPWLDAIAPGLALGQVIGRWGNFFNQELYGAPTNLPWKLFIDPAHRLPGYQNVAYYHPLFLYESIWDLANMAILLWLSRHFNDRLKDGDIFLVYLVIYSIGRFLLEFLRLDASRLAGINANQTLSAIVAVVAVAAIIVRHWPRSSAQATKDSVVS